MEKINFEDAQLVQASYVEIDNTQYEVHEAEYESSTPLSSYVLNKLQDNIEKELNTTKTIEGETIIVENVCPCNSDLRVLGKTIKENNIIKNIKENVSITKENEDTSVSETIIFPLSEGQVLHEGDYLKKDGIHQNKGTVILTGTETWIENNRYYYFISNEIKKIKNIENTICSHFWC